MVQISWTNPKTWSVGETLTAANFNAQIRDNELAMGPHLIVRKTSDQSVTSSTTLVDDSALQLTVGANDVWQLHFNIRYTADAAGDIQVTFSIPTSGRVNASAWHSGAGDNFQNDNWDVSTSDTGPVTFGGWGTTIRTLPIFGTYIGGGTAGTVKLRWAQGNSIASATSVLTHSTLWAMQLV